MGDRWEARLNAIENIQEEVGHDIREMKEQLVRLTSLFEDHIKTGAAQTQGSSPLPNHQVPRPLIRTASYLPCRTDRPNLRQPWSTASPTFMATSRPIGLPRDSRGKPNERRMSKWDPIPITYTELFPKLIENGFLVPFYLPPLTPPFPRWYNANSRCDYHAGNPGHSTENCTALKRQVQSLIKDGKLKFEESDESIEVEDPSKAKAEITRQKRETSNKASTEKAKMPKGKVPNIKIERSEVGCSSTTKGSKERSCEPNGEEEGKAFQDLVWNLEQMLRKQNEYITALKGEHNGQTLKRRWTPGSDDA